MSVSKNVARKVVKPRVSPEQTEPAPRTKHHIQPDVLEFIRKADGVPVGLTELSVHLQVPKASAQHAALKLSQTVPQIEVVTRGQVWRWNHRVTDLSHREQVTGDFGPVPEPELPEGRPDDATVKVYTRVGKAADGNDVIRDSEDNLYRAVPL